MTPIATATNTAGPPITVGSEPDAIAITPDGKTAYAANFGSGTVTPIATATNTAGPPITVGSEPIAIAITPATVTRAPVFTSRSAATAAYGAAFSFMVTTTGSPAPRISRTGRAALGREIHRSQERHGHDLRDSQQGNGWTVPVDPDGQEHERDCHPGVHPDRHPGPGPPEDPDHQDQSTHAVAADHQGNRIPCPSSGRDRAPARRPDLH